MHYVYGWFAGAVMGSVATWIYKSHLQHEAGKLRSAAEAEVRKTGVRLR